MQDRDARVTAVLGPTNTGKTHYAIERMLGHRTGVIGLPLRLLAREVYDRIVGLRGPSVVALVTGEERIVPPRAAYWVCTVEAMPVDLGTEFLAVDEIQLCADPERGYIFTDRLLNARGMSETLFLGAETMRARIASLIPGAQFMRRERFSRLTYSGTKKISRMPERSAIVGFSVENVYAIAELIRRQKGGAAVVMGALSPRTRNAQVALYQNGDVDHLVATDAIGMGLNLDIRHVAFAGLSKFDGRRHRHLAPNELAQIAGRAGRYTDDGTFGVTAEAAPMDEDVVDAIENHRFTPIRRLQWRNGALEFGTPERLIASLEQPSAHGELSRTREADDLATLKALWSLPVMQDRVRAAPDVRLLWDVCQIPDFRNITAAEHATLCQRIFEFLHEGSGIPTDWLAAQIERIDKTTGDIDTLSRRLAFIRTWTYVAQRRNWVDDTNHWREETRAVEDRLSDALHACLTQRFVDRRTSVLMRRLKERESLVADVNDKGEVRIEDQYVGKLEGFRFRFDESASPQEAKTLRAAGMAALQPALSLRSDKFYNAPDTEIDVTEQGGLMWGNSAVGKLVAGADPLSPQIAVFVDDEAGPEVAERVRRRLQHWIDRKIAALFAPLIALRDDETLAGMARGIAFRLVEAMGVLPRADIADDVKALDQDQRALLRKHTVRFGQFTVFQPQMLKPAPTRMRLVLWGLHAGLDEFPSAPPPGLVTVPALRDAPGGYYSHAGYRLAGDRAIRIDMLERLADMIRGQDTRAGFEATPDMLSITGLTLDQFANLMDGMGYKSERGERPKQRALTAAPKGAAAPVALAANAAADVAPAEAAADAAPAEAAVDAAPAEAAADVAPAEAAVDAALTETAAEAAADAAPAEAVASEGKPAADAAPSEAVEEAAQADRVVEQEVFYTFTWAPRRRPAPQQQTARGDQPSEAKPGGKRPPRGKGKRPDRANQAPDQKAGERPDQKPGHKPGQKQRHERGKDAAAAPHKPPREKPRERPVDPDNPFAALLALKQKL